MRIKNNKIIDIILKEKFGNIVEDYKKDILINFNKFYKEAAKRENIVANAATSTPR